MNKEEGVKITTVIGYLFIINGLFFFLITAVGMIRFEDFYIRLHIVSKSLTGGGVSTLLGLIFLEGPSLYSLKLGVIIIFLIISNPVTSHALARAGYYSGLDADHPSSILEKDELAEEKADDLR